MKEEILPVLKEFYIECLDKDVDTFTVFNESRCVLNLFERGFKAFKNNLGSRLIAEGRTNKKDFSDFQIHSDGRFIQVPVIFNPKTYFEIESETKKRNNSSCLDESYRKASRRKRWDITPIEKL